MHRTSLLPILALSLIATACVSKSDHEALLAELAACDEAKVQAEASVITWEQRFDRESNRWEQMEQSVSSALPQALDELNSERERILKVVPEQVQSEVSGYLDEYFNTVMRGFEQLQQDNREITIRLDTTQTILENLGQDTKSIGKSIDDSLTAEKSKRDRVASDLSDIIDQLVQFDQTRLTSAKAPPRLKMRDKSREALLAFHSELVSDLAQLQTFASLPVAEDGQADGDEAEPEAGTDEATTDSE